MFVSSSLFSFLFFFFFFFFFNDTATTEIYTSIDTLSLHDALPIYRRRDVPCRSGRRRGCRTGDQHRPRARPALVGNRLARDPGVLGGGELADYVRQFAGDEVGEGDLLEHVAEAGADGDPDFLQVLGVAAVLDVLRRGRLHVGDRTLDGADNLG